MTTERSTAEWFAKNWSMSGGSPNLLKLQIPNDVYYNQLRIIELAADRPEYIRLTQVWGKLFLMIYNILLMTTMLFLLLFLPVQDVVCK